MVLASSTAKRNCKVRFFCVVVFFPSDKIHRQQYFESAAAAYKARYHFRPSEAKYRQARKERLAKTAAARRAKADAEDAKEDDADELMKHVRAAEALGRQWTASGGPDRSEPANPLLGLPSIADDYVSPQQVKRAAEAYVRAAEALIGSRRC